MMSHSHWPRVTTARGNHNSDFCPYRLVLSVYVFHINGIVHMYYFVSSSFESTYSLLMHVYYYMHYYMQMVHSYSLLCSIPPDGYTTIYLPITLLMDIWVVSTSGSYD